MMFCNLNCKQKPNL